MKWLWFLFSFSGRVPRRPYWIFSLSIVGAFFFIAIAGELSGGFDFELYGGLFGLIVLWPIIAVHIKRWHDRGRSGWLLLLGAIPGGLYWILFECGFIRGGLGSNRFGADTEGALGIKGNVDRFYPVLAGLLVCLSLASTSFPRYRIPSGAMMPTILVGDFVIVNRLAYGLPMPYTTREATSLSHPAKGDVIVFHYPLDESVQYVKRVVGQPGDTIAYIEKELYINGERLPQTELGIYEGEGAGAQMNGALLRSERLGGMGYSVLIHSESPDFVPGCKEMEGNVITVPEDHYFVMGDNRDNSNDSRCWGFVPRENVVGKVLLVWMSWDSQRQGFPLEYSRIGKLIR